MTATVWLAKDEQASKTAATPKYVAVKISVTSLGNDFLDSRRKIARKLFSTDPTHPGYAHVRFMLDTFKLRSRGGDHLCVAYDVLREPINQCMEKWESKLFTAEKFKILMPALLEGLDYMHASCGIVHTDLKADNIMMGLGDASVLETFVRQQIARPPAHKPADHHGRMVYESCSDFGAAPNDTVIASAKITDIGLAEWGDEPNNKPIQSNAFTCPEVILIAGWSYPADIWNLGVMMWDLVENFGIFDTIDTRPGHYRSDQHLGLMIALLGPPPTELLERGSTSATYFDDNGNFRKPALIPKEHTFENFVTRMKGEEKELFIDMAKKMICWLPEERWTAKQLLDHPFLTKTDVNCRETEAEKQATIDLVERFAINKTRSNTGTPIPPASPIGSPSPSLLGLSMSNRASTVGTISPTNDRETAQRENAPTEPVTRVTSTATLVHRDSNTESQTIIDGILGHKKMKAAAAAAAEQDSVE